MEYKKIIPTCSLCTHFDAIEGKCLLTGDPKVGYDIDSPKECITESKYARYINAIPGIFNYYTPDEDYPPLFTPNYSNVAKDINGKALVVQTRRGLERAIPVDYSIELIVNPLFSTVDLVYTTAGQRDMIRLLGYDYTKSVAEKYNVPFIGTLDEAHYRGSSKERKKFENSERLVNQIKWR